MWKYFSIYQKTFNNLCQIWICHQLILQKCQVCSKLFWKIKKKFRWNKVCWNWWNGAYWSYLLWWFSQTGLSICQTLFFGNFITKEAVWHGVKDLSIRVMKFTNLNTNLLIFQVIFLGSCYVWKISGKTISTHFTFHYLYAGEVNLAPMTWDIIHYYTSTNTTIHNLPKRKKCMDFCLCNYGMYPYKNEYLEVWNSIPFFPSSKNSRKEESFH